MMTRGLFILSTLAAAGTTTVPKPSPAPSPTPFPWDMCDQNPTLPYDRPLGLHMRVLDGPDFDLVKYRGYAVMLNIFATWCPPCNKEMPSLVAMDAKYRSKGLRLIGIDYAETDDTVRAFRKKFGVEYPIAMDEQGGFAFSLEHGNKDVSTEFPVTLFITPDGYLYCDKRGTTDDPAAELEYRIQKFLKDAPPTKLAYVSRKRCSASSAI